MAEKTYEALIAKAQNRVFSDLQDVILEASTIYDSNVFLHLCKGLISHYFLVPFNTLK